MRLKNGVKNTIDKMIKEKITTCDFFTLHLKDYRACNRCDVYKIIEYIEFLGHTVSHKDNEALIFAEDGVYLLVIFNESTDPAV